MTHPHGDVVTYTYDENESSARGNVTTTTWTPAGGGNAITTHASYDASCTYPAKCNKPNTTTDGVGNVTSYTYDNTTGVVLTVTKPAGAGGVQPQTRYSYTQEQATYSNTQGPAIYLLTGISSCGKGSATGSNSCIGTSDEQRTSISYTGRLLPASVTTAAGDGSISSTQSFAYDAFANPVESTSPLNAVTVYVYDADRELTGAIAPDPAGSGSSSLTAVKVDYDGGGRLSYKEYGTVPGGAVDLSNFSQSYYDRYDYDSQDRVTGQRRGPYGQGAVNLTQYTYDNANRVQCVAVRMNASQFNSEPSSACTLGAAVASGPDEVTQYNYNTDDTVASVVSGYGTPQSHVSASYIYASDGLKTIDRDGKNNATCYGYDGFGRKTEASYEAPNTSNACPGTDYELYGYDSNNNLTSLRKRDGASYTLSYDALNQRVTGIGGESYAYDNLGHMVSAADSNTAFNATFAYDALGRMTSASRSGIGTATYQYDAAGDRTRLTWPDGFYVGYDYDQLGRLTAVLETGIATADYHTIANYAYDSLGRLYAQSRDAGTVDMAYSYDNVSRLSTITYAFPNSAYNNYLNFQYDEANHIMWRQNSNSSYYDWLPNVSDTSISYGIDGLNRVTSAGGGSFSYDAKGDLTSDTSNSYSYDAHNWMTAANSNSVIYDALGRMYLVTANSTKTHFLYDGAGGQLIGEYADSGALLRRYIPGAGTDETVAWYEENGGGRRYQLPDEKGSIVATVDTSGNPYGFNTYDEFGAPGGANIGRIQYTGQAWLPEAGLYYYKARMYSPTLGRFMQTDPIGYQDGMNWYNYAHGDPVNGSDPSGTIGSDDNETKPSYTSGPGGNTVQEVVVNALKPVTAIFSSDFGSGGGSGGGGGGGGGGSSTPQNVVQEVVVTAKRLPRPTTQLQPTPIPIVFGGLPSPISIAAGPRASSDDREKAAQEDEAICRSLSDLGARARCWESANARDGARSRGLPPPPLITWFLGGGAVICAIVEPCGSAVVTALGLGALLGAGAQ